MNFRTLLILCCLGLAGCPGRDKAYLRIEQNFTDRQLAGRSYFINEPSEKSRAQELISEIANRDAELQRTMLSASFKKLPVQERMMHFNECRRQNWELIKELRAMLADKEAR